MKKLKKCIWFLIFLVLCIVSNRQLTADKAIISIPNYQLRRLFPLDTDTVITFSDSILAGLVLDDQKTSSSIIVPVSNGRIAALNSDTGAMEWQIKIPSKSNQQIQLVATPIKIGHELVVVYQCVEKGERTSHRMAVLNLSSQTWDENFPVLELKAEKPTRDGNAIVKFNPPTAYSHAALKYARKSGSKWGYVYAAFGNAGDTQPFHGWLFEIDMGAWFTKSSDKIISSTLLTTPETECPVSLEYGTQEMICGGGIWSPAGPQIYQVDDNGYELIVPTGNGQLDLDHYDYANTLMRVQSGLEFDPGCDETLCRNFNPSQPEEACISSCKNLFIPRLPNNEPPFRPANGECDNKSFAECLAWMDYDLGGSSPVKAKLPNGKSVLVQPGKDGAVYLIDADHLGTQFDRMQIVDLCGTTADVCKASWMGMIVTHPALAYVDSKPIVIVPAFVPDNTHPAGVVALQIIDEDGKPKFKKFWQFPQPGSSKSVKAFRSHPSLPVVTKIGDAGDAVVWVVDVGNPGKLYGIRIKDGALLVEQPLLGTGRQLSAPVIHGKNLYISSVYPANGKTFVEAYRIESINH